MFKTLWNINNWRRHVAHNYLGHLHMCQPIKPVIFHFQQWMWVHSTVALIGVIASKCSRDFQLRTRFKLHNISLFRECGAQILTNQGRPSRNLSMCLQMWANIRYSNTWTIQRDRRRPITTAGTKHKCRVRTTESVRRRGRGRSNSTSTVLQYQAFVLPLRQGSF